MKILKVNFFSISDNFYLFFCENKLNLKALNHFHLKVVMKIYKTTSIRFIVIVFEIFTISIHFFIVEYKIPRFCFHIVTLRGWHCWIKCYFGTIVIRIKLYWISVGNRKKIDYLFIILFIINYYYSC
jgi:hypothetical protein